LGEADGTLHATVDHVMVSFFHYSYGLLFPPVKFEGLMLADERDIAAMKLDADKEPPPVMLRDTSWDDMKQSISQAVSVYSKKRG